MDMTEAPLVNRVAESGLVTINLEDFYPRAPILTFDLKEHLFQGLILKEKDFREALKNHDWAGYKDAYLAVHCSSDAIIPVWAYMLVTALATPFALQVRLCAPDEFLARLYEDALAGLDTEPYRGQRVVIKGCSDKPVPPSAYVTLTRLLQPLAQSVMYGEPCSTVPVFKRPRTLS